MTTATKQWTAAQAKAAAKWAKEMGALDPERTGAWTAFEVGEYHSAGIIGVCEPERARLDQLFVNAGGERVLAAWLSVQTDERWTAAVPKSRFSQCATRSLTEMRAARAG